MLIIRVRSVIAVGENGKNYYDHKLTEIEIEKLIDLVVGITTPVPDRKVFLSEFKDKRLLSILQIKNQDWRLREGSAD